MWGGENGFHGGEIDVKGIRVQTKQLSYRRQETVTKKMFDGY